MKRVLLSFDLEEFDMPLEYKHEIPFSDQIRVSQEGTRTLLSILGKHEARATFFSTYQFAKESVDLINQVKNQGHEIGSHSYHHSSFEPGDLLKSKEALESLGLEISGFRMPRMMPVDYLQLMDAGYRYDSSLHPIFLPGRYNHYFKPRGLHKIGELWELPASTTPVIRVPLFWLSFHHFPMWLYKILCRAAFFPGDYVVIYFHPWEFVSLEKQFGLPDFLTKNTGNAMCSRFSNLISWMKKLRCEFVTFTELIEGHEKNQTVVKM